MGLEELGYARITGKAKRCALWAIVLTVSDKLNLSVFGDLPSKVCVVKVRRRVLIQSYHTEWLPVP